MWRNFNSSIAYKVDNVDAHASIVIDEIEYSRMEDGVNMVVLDIILGRVVDSVTLEIIDGNIHINR